ncbi:hypothetical protein GCM10023193_03220 [Planotetraspora kaengkrachanensis]|uniref:Uncharacterized protein n=1 Tax=Planotetraspora kaengkrachanensis TaxID=575193 RepID=A0A8J3M131_9ACTN|nr:hypothetical protein Pka01_02370 [Planotetraspora kaengkrachanensis]
MGAFQQGGGTGAGGGSRQIGHCAPFAGITRIRFIAVESLTLSSQPGLPGSRASYVPSLALIGRDAHKAVITHCAQ